MRFLPHEDNQSVVTELLLPALQQKTGAVLVLALSSVTIWRHVTRYGHPGNRPSLSITVAFHRRGLVRTGPPHAELSFQEIKSCQEKRQPCLASTRTKNKRNEPLTTYWRPGSRTTLSRFCSPTTRARKTSLTTRAQKRRKVRRSG